MCIVEPLLCLRRVSLNLAKKVVAEKMRNAIPYLDDLIGECWLLSSRTARKIGVSIKIIGILYSGNFLFMKN